MAQCFRRSQASPGASGSLGEGFCREVKQTQATGLSGIQEERKNGKDTWEGVQHAGLFALAGSELLGTLPQNLSDYQEPHPGPVRPQQGTPVSHTLC